MSDTTGVAPGGKRLSERPCRYDTESGPLFSDSQLAVWHDIAASGHGLTFNAATTEALLDEIRHLRAELTDTRAALAQAEERTAALVDAGNGMAACIEDSLVNLAPWEHSPKEDVLASWRVLAAAGRSSAGGGERDV